MLGGSLARRGGGHEKSEEPFGLGKKRKEKAMWGD